MEREITSRIEELVAQTKMGIFATVGVDKAPHIRWMTPALLKDRPGLIYTFAAAGSQKVRDLAVNGQVEWLFQDKTLRRVAAISGLARVIENPALRTEIMEALGRQLETFWKVNIKEMDIVIIETLMQSATWLEPGKGATQVVGFEFE